MTELWMIRWRHRTTYNTTTHSRNSQVLNISSHLNQPISINQLRENQFIRYTQIYYNAHILGHITHHICNSRPPQCPQRHGSSSAPPAEASAMPSPATSCDARLTCLRRSRFSQLRGILIRQWPKRRFLKMCFPRRHPLILHQLLHRLR